MKKIKDKVVVDLLHTSIEVAGLYDKVDAVIAKASEEIAELLREINGKRDDAERMLREEFEKIANYYDNRAESWQEGEKGQAYDTWKNRVEAVVNELGTEVEIELEEIERPEWVDSLSDPEFAELEAED